MTWAATVDQLEVILISCLIAFGFMAVVATIVGTFTLWITREHTVPGRVMATVTPRPQPLSTGHATETATAIAG